MRTLQLFCLLSLLWLSYSLAPTGYPTKVSYDSRAFTINGTRELLLSGSVHYTRSTPSEWPGILKLTKEGGIDLLQVYVFWDIHQPNGPDEWYFEGRANIWEFIDRCQEAGLFVNLRIGPYVCTEWNLGGIPVWVKDIPGIVFRDYNGPWMKVMGDFVTRFVKESLSRKIFAHQGGPVIIAQIENEYGNIESGFKDPKRYIAWAIDLARNLTNVEPWIVCQQDDAPDLPNLVNTCNGFYCDNWLPGHFAQRNTPAAWTENWPGWFQYWGDPKVHRDVRDVAFAVCRWFARGGALMNYYLFQGGTTWDRFTGGPFYITSYDYDVAIDEYGKPHNPKYSHSLQLHNVLKDYAAAIINNPVDPGKSLGNMAEVSVYGTPGKGGPRDCVAFLSNSGLNNVTVTWNGHQYTIPAWSVSILGGCGTTVTFNSAHIQPFEVQSEQKEVGAIQSWSWWSDSVGLWDPKTAINNSRPLEQVSTTHDVTDYFWYHVQLPSTTAGSHTLETNANDIAYFYVNGKYQQMVRSGNPASVRLDLPSGSASLDILTLTNGLQNYGAHYEEITRGIAGRKVMLDNTDITTPAGGWSHQVGLKGEYLKVPTNSKAVQWNNQANEGLNKPLTWWRATFATPAGDQPLALDITGLTKGFVYVNGHGVGRYWNIIAHGNCPPCSEIDAKCDYRGAYDPSRCLCDCGVMSERYYHIPRDWLVAGENVLIFIEEIGASDVNTVQIVTRT